MKKYILFFAVLTCLAIFCGCAADPNYTKEQMKKEFASEHLLRQVIERDGHKSHLSGGFFLFIGGISGEEKNTYNVIFSWQTIDGTYIISQMPIDKIRVKLDPAKQQPSIKFEWDHLGWQVDDDFRYEIKYSVKWATITCRPEQWPINIKMPLA